MVQINFLSEVWCLKGLVFTQNHMGRVESSHLPGQWITTRQPLEIFLKGVGTSCQTVKMVKSSKKAKSEVFTLPPLFWADSGRTPTDSTYPECQIFGSGIAGIVQWLSGDFLVHAHRTGWVRRTFWWTDRWNITKPAVIFHWKWPDSSRKSNRSPAEVRRTPTNTKQTAFLTSIINKKWELKK